MFELPVSLRMRWARCFRSMGPYVSGLKMRIGQARPANMRFIQYAHRQPRPAAAKPEITGPIKGPQLPNDQSDDRGR